MSLCWDDGMAKPLPNGCRKHAVGEEKDRGRGKAQSGPVSMETAGANGTRKSSKQRTLGGKSGRIALLIAPIFTEYAGRILV
jgi:hypothetical protein